jgi:hypothetical protein
MTALRRTPGTKSVNDTCYCVLIALIGIVEGVLYVVVAPFTNVWRLWLSPICEDGRVATLAHILDNRRERVLPAELADCANRGMLSRKLAWYDVCSPDLRPLLSSSFEGNEAETEK